jgi:hypothetical protein
MFKEKENFWKTTPKEINPQTNTTQEGVFRNLSDVREVWPANAQELLAKVANDPLAIQRKKAGIITLKLSPNRTTQYLWVKPQRKEVQNGLDKFMSQPILSDSEYCLGLDEIFNGFPAQPAILIELEGKDKQLTSKLFQFLGVFISTKDVDLSNFEKEHSIQEYPIHKSQKQKRNFKLGTVFFVDIWEFEPNERGLKNVVARKLLHLSKKVKRFELFMQTKKDLKSKHFDCHTIAFIGGVDSVDWYKAIAALNEENLSYAEKISFYELPKKKQFTPTLQSPEEDSTTISSGDDNKSSQLLTKESFQTLKMKCEIFKELPILIDYLQSHFNDYPITSEDIISLQENSQNYLKMKTNNKLMTVAVEVAKNQIITESDDVPVFIAESHLTVGEYFELLGFQTYDNWLFELNEQQAFTGQVENIHGIYQANQDLKLQSSIFWPMYPAKESEIIIKKDTIVYVHCYADLKVAKLCDNEDFEFNEQIDQVYHEDFKEFLKGFLDTIIKFEEFLQSTQLVDVQNTMILLFIIDNKQFIEPVCKEIYPLLDTRKQSLLSKTQILDFDRMELLVGIIPDMMRKMSKTRANQANQASQTNQTSQVNQSSQANQASQDFA